jgi:hypothetical protein
MSARRLCVLVPLVCAVLLSGAPARAQDTPPAPQRPADQPPVPQPPDEPAVPQEDDVPEDEPARKPGLAIRGRVFGLAGFQSFTATDSFSAVLDSSSGPVFGGGGGLLLGRNVFVDVSVSRFSADGTRVFIADGGEVIDLGIPTQVTVTPIDVSIGWRFAGTPRVGPSGKPGWRPVPFAGGGFGFQQYEETGDFASSGEDVSESHGSYHVLGGIELPFGRHLAASADVLYRWVPDGLGESGVSAYYDEKDLGGAQIRVRVMFAF